MSARRADHPWARAQGRTTRGSGRPWVGPPGDKWIGPRFLRMSTRLLLLLLAAPLAAQSPTIPFTPGMVVTSSVRILPGTYQAPASDSAVMVIRGRNITVDMRGVELVGSDQRNRPDKFSGTAVRIDGGSNITVRGATIRGYRIGLIARGVRNLRLLDNDLSYNWKNRLMSGIEKESLVDWMSYHQNEKDEWLKHAAAIYLVDVRGGELKGNRVRQGQNALLLTRTDSLLIWNNDFSFNSGLGIGMYRASYNTLMHNRIDWNVRGYSHGFYNRGQDSAGLLMYEQSCHNIVAHNSVTHSGDGLFLWAGQSTMDSGHGGANDNLFYANDFSHAPTNGIETTFSRNVFAGNRVEENWHGVWGGYSYETVYIGNDFRNNVEAIAIEHGQDNRIIGNTFRGDTTAIRLWWNRVEPSDWGYPKYRDTRSRDVVILGNTFSDNRLALRIDNTQRVRVDGNAFVGVDSLTRLSGDTAGWTMTPDQRAAMPVTIPARYRVAKRAGGIDAMIPAGAMRGRKTIIVDEWGPYDWQSPKLWPVARSDANLQRLRVLGPVGTWRVVTERNIASVSARSGRVGDTLTVTPAADHMGDWSVELEYHGGAVTTPFGERIAARKPVRFAWRHWVPAITWHLVHVAWDSTTTPRTGAAAITRALGGTPVASSDTSVLDLTWYRPPDQQVPQANVLTGATADVALPAGRYVLRTIADDAIRVYIDDKLVLDDWTPGESRVRETSFTSMGRHQFRVEHLQLDGWYELRVDIVREN